MEDVRLFLSNIVEQFRSSSAGQCQDRSAELSTSSSAPLFPDKCARVLRSSSVGVFPDTSAPMSLNNSVLSSADQLLGAKSVTELRNNKHSELGRLCSIVVWSVCLNNEESQSKQLYLDDKQEKFKKATVKDIENLLDRT